MGPVLGGAGKISAANSVDPIDVVCIKWGDKYKAEHVNRLSRGVARFIDRPHRFHCFTDDAQGIDADVKVHDLPREPFESALLKAMTRTGRKGAWRKISLFKPDLAGLKGPRVYFDLDVIIVGPLGDLLDLQKGKVYMRREWRYERLGKQGGHGSFEMFDPEKHSFLYDVFAKDPEWAVEHYKASEQYYTSMLSLERGMLEYLPGDMICSFKNDSMRRSPLNYFVEPKLTPNCRILCFHGKPKMEEAVHGYHGSIFRHSLRAEWLSNYHGN